MSQASTPPRGWYPDPGGSSAWRWWDGERWTEELEQYGGHQASLRDILGQESRAASQLLTYGVPLLALAIIVGTWLSWVSLPDLAIQLRWAKTAIVAAAHNEPLPTQPRTDVPAWQGAVSWLIRIPAEITGLILLLRFQFRSAKAARGLGLGDRPSPGLGVGGWFIPIAAVWIPLRAWLHLTTPRARLRSLIWLAWGAMLLGGASAIGGMGLSVVSFGWARVLLGLGLAAQGAAVALLPGLVKGIGAAHQQASGERGTERGVAGAL